MSNSYSQHAMEFPLKGDFIEFEKLKALLDSDREKEENANRSHGFEIEFIKDNDLETIGEIHLYAEHFGDVDDLPSSFRKALGKLIKKNGLPWLQFGYACYADKMRPSEFGGGDYRIDTKGNIIYPLIIWE